MEAIDQAGTAYVRFESKAVVSSPNHGGMFKVTVTDTGGGGKGTGLRLPLCKDMLARNGGCIRVKNEPDKGSRFHFTLPIKSGEK